MANDDGNTASSIVDSVTESDSDTQNFDRRRALKAVGAVGVGAIGLGVIGTALESNSEGTSASGSSGGGGAGGSDSGGQATQQPDQSESTPQPTASQYAYRESGIGLYDDVRWQEGEFGNLSIEGTAVNVTDSTLEYVQVSVAFLDATGAQIETNLDNTNNLAAGQEWRYSVMYPGMDTSEVNDAEITGIDAY